MPLCSLYWKVIDESALVRMIWNVLLPPVLQNAMLSYSTMKLSCCSTSTRPSREAKPCRRSQGRIRNGASWLFGFPVLGTAWNGDAIRRGVAERDVAVGPDDY